MWMWVLFTFQNNKPNIWYFQCQNIIIFLTKRMKYKNLRIFIKRNEAENLPQECVLPLLWSTWPRSSLHIHQYLSNKLKLQEIFQLQQPFQPGLLNVLRFDWEQRTLVSKQIKKHNHQKWLKLKKCSFLYITFWTLTKLQ